jgi:hypothetical protein
MKETDKVAHRLVLLTGVNLSTADIESIVKEIEDNERVVAELEEFSEGNPWIASQIQPVGKKG